MERAALMKAGKFMLNVCFSYCVSHPVKQTKVLENCHIPDWDSTAYCPAQMSVFTHSFFPMLPFKLHLLLCYESLKLLLLGLSLLCYRRQQVSGSDGLKENNTESYLIKVLFS